MPLQYFIKQTIINTYALEDLRTSLDIAIQHCTPDEAKCLQTLVIYGNCLFLSKVCVESDILKFKSNILNCNTILANKQLVLKNKHLDFIINLIDECVSHMSDVRKIS